MVRLRSFVWFRAVVPTHSTDPFFAVPSLLTVALRSRRSATKSSAQERLPMAVRSPMRAPMRRAQQRVLRLHPPNWAGLARAERERLEPPAVELPAQVGRRSLSRWVRQVAMPAGAVGILAAEALRV